MKLLLVRIVPQKRLSQSSPTELLFASYLARIRQYGAAEERQFRSEDDMFASLSGPNARQAPYVILLDREGRLLNSEDWAKRLGDLRDSAVQSVVLAIGPADGWTAAARSRANLLLSFGPMTLPHDLARVVLAEQVYRAFTILAHHPYHSGH